ncbi:MAG: hypothetical protein HFJ87_10565 [Muribaculaceae bacterium]|nr:hypothetical protein [Muribaculaceae bacterium]
MIDEIKKKTCFIITPVGNERSDIRRMADGVIISGVRPVLEARGFEVIAPHEMANPGSIEMTVIQQILDCDLVIANLTGLNPNVMYELAVRHSFGKPVVCIAENGTTLPFDIHSQQTLFYTNDMYGVKELQESLPDYIEKAMTKDPLNPIINAKSDLHAAANASDPEKTIINKLNALMERLPSVGREPKNTYRKDRPNGMVTFYICTEADALAYDLFERGYKLVVRDNKYLGGQPWKLL